MAAQNEQYYEGEQYPQQNYYGNENEQYYQAEGNDGQYDGQYGNYQGYDNQGNYDNNGLYDNYNYDGSYNNNQGYEQGNQEQSESNVNPMLNKLPTGISNYGKPQYILPYRHIPNNQQMPNGMCNPMNMCKPNVPKNPILEYGNWQWTSNGTLKLGCSQPIVPVPVVQEIHRRDKIIQVPQLDIYDAVQPKIFNQGIQHDVPKIKIEINEKSIEIPTIKYSEKEVIVPIITGYTHKFVPKWEIREVPRPVVRYVGKQECIEIEVPKVEFVDKIVEREVIVDTINRKIPKIIEVEEFYETVEYKWKPVVKIVHVNKFMPKYDVDLDCPAPLIVPYPVQKVTEMPAVMERLQPVETLPEEFSYEVEPPPGTTRVPEEYILEYKPEESCTSCNFLSNPITDYCSFTQVVSDVPDVPESTENEFDISNN